MECFSVDVAFLVKTVAWLVWLRFSASIRWRFIVSAVPLLFFFANLHFLFPLRRLHSPSLSDASWLFALELATQLRLAFLLFRSPDGFSFFAQAKGMVRVVGLVVLPALGKERCNIAFAFCAIGCCEEIFWDWLDMLVQRRGIKRNVTRGLVTYLLLGKQK
jgi:hypothetical protein